MIKKCLKNIDRWGGLVVIFIPIKVVCCFGFWVNRLVFQNLFQHKIERLFFSILWSHIVVEHQKMPTSPPSAWPVPHPLSLWAQVFFVFFSLSTLFIINNCCRLSSLIEKGVGGTGFPIINLDELVKTLRACRYNTLMQQGTGLVRRFLWLFTRNR